MTLWHANDLLTTLLCTADAVVGLVADSGAGAGASEPPRRTWPGSSNHGLGVLISGLVIFLAVQWGRVLAYHGQEARYRLFLGLVGVAGWVAINLWYALPGQFDWKHTLPLHICDLGNLLAGVVLLTGGRSRTLRAVLYFWAFALTLQGFVTPVVQEGPSSPTYWLFWLNHGIVVGFAIYDIVVAGFRPTLMDLGRACIVSAGYVAVVLPIDLIFGWNYGYLAPDLPDTTTLLSALGDWPGRLFKLMGLAFLSFVIVYLPWPITRAWARA